MDSSGRSAPVILTLRLDPASFKRLEELRQRYFPKARNFIPAHCSLFHQLPGDELESILQTLEAVTSAQSEFAIEFSGLRSLGRGVAYTMHAPELLVVREQLVRAFTIWLTPQDRARFQPHITVQNKVSAADASATLRRLRKQPELPSGQGTGICVWKYLGGPWEHVQTFSFRSPDVFP